MNSRRAYNPDDPPIYFPTVLITSIVVEWVRFELHPETYNLVPNPVVFAGFCVCANVSFHLWNRSGNNVKAAVSAILGETSMWTFMAVLVAFMNEIGEAILRFVMKLTAPSGPHGA